MSDPNWPENEDYTFDPAEEYIGVGGRRMSRRRLLAGAGAAIGAAAAGPLIFTTADADELARDMLKSNLPYKANTSVKGHVVFWHHYGSPLRHGAILEAISAFKKIYKGVSVSDVGFAFGANWDEMKTRIAAGSGIPDAIVSDRPKLYYDGAKKHYYQDVSDLVKRDGFKMSQYWHFIQRDSIINKKVYGLGWETDCRVLFHLRATMIDNGLKPDASPKTWNDIKTFANKLDQKGGKLNGYSLVTFDPLENYDLVSWSWTNNTDAVNKKGQPDLNNPKMVQTAQWIKSWYDRYGGYKVHTDIANNSGGSQAMNAMTAKNTVFHVAAPTDQAVWEFYDLRFYTKAGKRIYPFYGAALLPHNTGGKPSNLTGGFDISMPAKHESAAQRNATWEFVKFMSVVGQRYFARRVTAVPSVQSMATHDSVLTLTPNWKTFIQGMQNGHPGIQAKDPSFPGDALTSSITDAMWRGDKSIQDGLNEAQSQALNNNKKPGT